MRIGAFGALAIALLAAQAAVAGRPSSSRGAETALTLQLRGGDSVRPDRACGSRGRFVYYRVDGRVSFHGRVTPAPGRRIPVRIVVRRCFGSSFEVVKTLTVKAFLDGQYNGSFGVAVPSKCFVQASYAGAKSPRGYFRVR